jgi:flagellar hook assembly protein FlgD
MGNAVFARLTIHDLAGRLVRSFDLAPQVSEALSLDWDGKDESGRLLPTGIYVCRLEAGGSVSSAHIVLVR